MEKRRRAHEAREEEWKEQEKKRYEEDYDEWVPVVLNLEAGGSYLQTLIQETQKKPFCNEDFGQKCKMFKNIGNSCKN